MSTGTSQAGGIDAPRKRKHWPWIVAAGVVIGGFWTVVGIGAMAGASSEPVTEIPTPTVTSSPTSESSPTPKPTLVSPAPDTVGKPLDEAKSILEEAGYTVKVTDSRENRTIFDEQNWVVTSQDVQARSVNLGARKVSDKSDEEIAAEKAAAEEAAAEEAARVAAEQAAAEQAAAEQAAAEQAAAEEAARVAAEQEVQRQAPPPAPAPASAYYKNCTAAWDAGAAPLYRGDPGYRPKLDGDGDGVACEKRP